MGINNFLMKLEKKSAWTIISLLIAFILAWFPIYEYFIKDKNPILEFYIETNTKVLDVKENVANLDILFKKENIKENNKNLSILKIKIINTSSINIPSSYYDDMDPIGFQIKNGELVETPEVIDASNDYLKSKLRILKDTSNKVILPKATLDANDYFSIKVLVLSKDNEEVVICPFGKISGVKEIKIVNTFKLKNEKSFFDNLIEGSILIIIIRGIIYLIIFIIILFLIIYISDNFSNWHKKYRDTKIIKKYCTKKNIVIIKEHELVFKYFREHNIESLNLIKSLLKNDSTMLRRIKRIEEKEKREKQDGDKLSGTLVTKARINYTGEIIPYWSLFNDKDYYISDLLKNKIIEKNPEGTLVKNEIFINALNDFILFLNYI